MQQPQHLDKLTKQELHQALEFSRGIIDTLHTSLLVLDAGLRVVWANNSFYSLFLVTPQETERSLVYEIGARQLDVPDLRERLEGILGGIASITDFEIELHSPQTGRRTVVVNARVIHDGDPATLRILLAIDDITERKHIEEQRAATELRYHRLFETAQDGILILNAETGQVTDVNQYLLDMLGYSRDELVGKRLWDIGAFTDARRSREAYKELEKNSFVRFDDLPLETKTGQVMEVEFVSNAYLVNKERVIQCNFRDVSERKRLERNLAFSATHDSLTGLPNRTLFVDHYSLALAGAKRHHRRLAIMVLDIDHFKDINDSLGHHYGDQLLKEIGSRLSTVLRKADTVSRLGGDEFALLVTEAAGPEDEDAVAQKLLTNARKPFLLDDHEVRITASIGSSSYPDDSDEIETLIRLADKAMYQAKRNGRDNHLRYEPSMESQ
jgi:diguanylate cyclase (GGDEF)-like protein/PAS domain S-box-containing protein